MVDRYDTIHKIEQIDDGEYVLYSDYQRLEAALSEKIVEIDDENRKLKVKLKALRAWVAGIATCLAEEGR